MFLLLCLSGINLITTIILEISSVYKFVFFVCVIVVILVLGEFLELLDHLLKVFKAPHIDVGPISFTVIEMIYQYVYTYAFCSS